MDDVDYIINYENGELTDIQTLEMFSEFIKTKLVWGLQGHYGRAASALIEDGFIKANGELTEKANEFIELNE